jgi:hypothetical protein
MNKNGFKLKFETSEKFLAEMPCLLEKIVLQLRNEKYHIIQHNENMITFDDYKDPLSKVRGLISTSKLYEGEFEFFKEADLTKIKLTYFVPYRMFLIFLLAIIVISIFTDLSDLIMGGILMIFFTIEIFDQKSISKKLIAAINCSGS